MLGISLVIQWLRLCTSIARGTDSITGQGTKILHVSWCNQKKKKKKVTAKKSNYMLAQEFLIDNNCLPSNAPK